MIKTGDSVMVISGKEKGKTGKVLRVDRARERAVVEKLNMVKRHTRPNQQMRQGGIIEKEASIHISNLSLFCQKTQKPSRHRVGTDKKGNKIRVLIRTGEELSS